MNTSTPVSHVGSLINVLIVDDQKSMRSIIRQLLSSQGITHVTDAENGKEAMVHLQQIDAEKPDIIICDLYMDGMDGMEFVHQLRRRKDMTPVLILTGEQNTFMHEVTQQAGATKVLTKPISAPDLVAEIHQAIGAM